MITFSDIIKANCPNILPKYIDYVENGLRNLFQYPDERRYHTWEHVTNCLVELEQMSNIHKFEEYTIVALALFYHDCIYEPLNLDNEMRSAERAFIDLMALGFYESYAQRVYDHIMLTKHTKECTYFSGQVLMDIDLSILGKESCIFDKYEQAIEMEYRFIWHKLYLEERIKILKSFLNKTNIYQTDYFRDLYEKPARLNLETSIEKLGAYLKNHY
jgi:predicted metal-dependent HD superfamily phosphohydrolase